MSKTFNINYSTRPAQYGLIVEKVCPVRPRLRGELSFAFGNDGQMKELHPRFRFHTGDWITCHFAITHCRAMSRSFARLSPDPDIKIYERYMDKQRRNQQKEAQRALKKRRVAPPKMLGLPGPPVSTSVHHVQQSDALESQTRPRSKKATSAAGRSTSVTQKARNPTAANEVGSFVHIDPFPF